MKLTKGKSLPFDAVQPHQVTALFNAKNGKLVYKISDESYGQKPFDSFMLVGTPAWVVIMFYARGQKTFYMIDIDMWMNEEKMSERKSITEARAKEIGMECELA